jgi:hypothetical protein
LIHLRFSVGEFGLARAASQIVRNVMENDPPDLDLGEIFTLDHRHLLVRKPSAK